MVGPDIDSQYPVAGQNLAQGPYDVLRIDRFRIGAVALIVILLPLRLPRGNFLDPFTMGAATLAVMQGQKLPQKRPHIDIETDVNRVVAADGRFIYVHLYEFCRWYRERIPGYP